MKIAAIYLEKNLLDSVHNYPHKAEILTQQAPGVLVASYGTFELDYYYYLCFRESGDNKKAIEHLEAALENAQECNYIPLVLKYTNEIHSFLLKEGDSLKALHYLIRYNAIQDSLNKINTNAIWHGLMQKRTKGTITVDIRKENEKFLHISITDDGIGREKAAEMKSKSATHQSHGLKVTSGRIDMMNKLNSTGAQVHIVDLKDEQGNSLGTRVELIIPI